MARKPLTISVNPEVLEDFRKYCKKRDISMSRRIERYMKTELENKKDPANMNINFKVEGGRKQESQASE